MMVKVYKIGTGVLGHQAGLGWGRRKRNHFAYPCIHLLMHKANRYWAPAGTEWGLGSNGLRQLWSSSGTGNWGQEIMTVIRFLCYRLGSCPSKSDLWIQVLAQGESSLWEKGLIKLSDPPILKFHLVWLVVLLLRKKPHIYIYNISSLPITQDHPFFVFSYDFNAIGTNI